MPLTTNTILRSTNGTEVKYDLCDSSINNILLIGDSYAEGTDGLDGWIKRVPSMLPSDYTVQTLYKGGMGFVGLSGGDIASYIRANYTLISNRDLIRRIFIPVGYNDFSSDENSIITGIKNAVSACNEFFPNAVIYIGMIAWGTRGNDNAYLSEVVLPAYIKGAAQNKSIFMTGCENLMHGKDLNLSDGVHPNENGYFRLSTGISQYIQSGMCSVYDFYQTNIDLDSSIFPTNPNIPVTVQIQDNISEIVVAYSGNLNLPSGPELNGSGSTGLKIGTIKGIQGFNYNSTKYSSITIPCNLYVFEYQDNKYYHIPGTIFITNGNVYLYVIWIEGNNFKNGKVTYIDIDWCVATVPTMLI